MSHFETPSILIIKKSKEVIGMHVNDWLIAQRLQDKYSGINSKSHLKQNRALWLSEIEFTSAKRWGSHSHRKRFLKVQGGRLASYWSEHS